MAMHYDGIEPMLANMRWSTKSTYQIQSTFYVIYQTLTEDLLCQTAAWPDSAGRSVDMHRDGKSRITATKPRGQVSWRRKDRCRVELRYLFEGKVDRKVERPLIV